VFVAVKTLGPFLEAFAAKLLQLPWPAAMVADSGEEPGPAISVTPTTALIGRAGRPGAIEIDRVVISTSLPEEAFELADAIEARRAKHACPVEVHDQSCEDDHLDADTLILLSHGRRDSGLRELKMKVEFLSKSVAYFAAEHR
jgi:hypothetical protein